GHGAQRAFLPRLAPPVVAQLVPGHADQPRGGQRRGRAAPHGPGRVDRREERLRGEVLGDRPLPAPGQQVAIDLGQRPVIEVEEALHRVLPRQSLAAHTPIVVRAPRTPMGYPGVRPADGRARGPAVVRHVLRMPRLKPSGYCGGMPDGKQSLDIGGTTVVISNPGRVYFPHTGHTKLDLVRYYLAVAGGALLGAGGRPNVLKRFVNGAGGEPFFQKRAPDKRPAWIETVLLSFPSGRTAEKVIPRNAAALAWMANLGCIDLNPHPVRAEDLDHPDELRVDLDPVPDVEWPQIRQVALVARDVLADFGLTGWPKTSGSRGFH